MEGLTDRVIDGGCRSIAVLAWIFLLRCLCLLSADAGVGVGDTDAENLGPEVVMGDDWKGWERSAYRWWDFKSWTEELASG